MKREFTKKFEYLWSFYPIFFWHICSKCGKEFRRERGYHALVGKRDRRCLCATCAPTFEIANKYFLNKEWLRKRPTPPSPPPPPLKYFMRGE